VKLPHLQPSIHAHPGLHGINVSLGWDSEVSFDGPDWKLTAVPLFTINAPQIHHGDWLQLLRGEDGEIGISFDKNSSRHFFMLTNLSGPRFSIKFKVPSLFFIFFSFFLFSLFSFFCFFFFVFIVC
jgi:hypothetical protein